MIGRREYQVMIRVNGAVINRVLIDPHYERKRSAVINDRIIVSLVKKLSGVFAAPDKVNFPFSYFVSDKMELDGKSYKLIWLLEEGQDYVGVINAHRR
jgi:hypothetical protein